MTAHDEDGGGASGGLFDSEDLRSHDDGTPSVRDPSRPVLPSLLGLTDIIERWGYSREFVRQVMAQEADFPEPIGAINGGRNRFWLERDIEAFERTSPRLWQFRNESHWQGARR